MRVSAMDARVFCVRGKGAAEAARPRRRILLCRTLICKKLLLPEIFC